MARGSFLLVALTAALAAGTGRAQTCPPDCPTWAKSFGTAAQDGASTVVALSGGDVLAVGTTSGDVLLTRLDLDGTVVWAKQLGAAGGTDTLTSAVEVGADVVLVGSTDAFPASGVDAWVVRLDASGSVLWQKAFGTAGTDRATAALAAPGGGVYVVGHQGGEAWVARLDSAGAVVWEKRYSTLSASHAVAAAAGGLLVAGLRSEGGVTTFTLLRLDGDGVPVWQWRYPNDTFSVKHVAEGADGSWFVITTDSVNGNTITYLDRVSADGATGISRVLYSGLSAGPRTIVPTSDGGMLMAGTPIGFQFNAAALVKLDGNGSVVWQRRYGQPVTPQENAVAAVEVEGGFVFVGTTAELRPAGNGTDLFIGRTDASGEIPGAPCDLVEPTGVSPITETPATPIAVTPASAPASSTVATATAVATTVPGAAGACVNYDTDGDDVPDVTDNCVFVSNANQANLDGDTLGDVCDPDDDGDGAPDATDNCPLIANPTQLNSDGDDRGDACDACPFDAEDDIDGDLLCADVDDCDHDYDPGNACAPSSATTWGRNYGGRGTEAPGAVAAAPSGGLLVVGSVDDDALIVRLDPLGQTIWSRRLTVPGASGTLTRILPQPSGFLLGGVVGPFGAGGDDLWLVRIDDAGNVLWQKAYGTSFAEKLVALLPAPSGDAFLAARTNDAGWLARVDVSGNIVWETRYDTIALHAASTTADGGLVLLGGGADLTLLRVDPDGAPQWQYGYAIATTADIGVGVMQATDGTFWLLTQSSVGASIVNELLHVGATGSAVLARLGIAGLTRGLSSIFPTSDGGFAFSGSVPAIGPPNAWLVKLDAGGAITWQRGYGQPVSGNDFGGPAIELPGGGYALAGSADSLRPASHDTDLFVLRVDASGQLPGAACDLVGDTASRLSLQPFTSTAMNSPTVATAFTVTTTTALASSIPIGRGECVNYDGDGDGVPDATDNCDLVPNFGQQDLDGDGLGDACDPDDDNDGAPDETDNCPVLANPSQLNSDGDARGDACDPCPFDAADDLDGDGLCADVDNCPATFNPGQQDGDGDGIGDACETSPGTTWAKNFGGTGNDLPRAIAALPAGLVVVGRVNQDESVIHGLDATGTPVWQRSVVTPTTDDDLHAAVAAGSGVLLGGYTTAFGAGGRDAWLIRLDADGSVLWQKAYGGPGNDDIKTLLPAPGGGFFVAGFIGGAGGWIARIDDAGAIVWQKSYSSIGIADAVSTPDGGLVLAGTRSDPPCLGCQPRPNLTLLRVDGAGLPQWQYRWFGDSNSGPFNVKLGRASDGSHFIVSGESINGNGITYLTHVSADGTTVLLRSTIFGLDRGPKTVIGTSDGGVLLAGTNIPSESSAASLVKLDAAGTIVWGRKFGAPTQSGETAEVVAEVPGGGYVFAGFTGKLRPAANALDLFVGRVDALGHMPDSPCDLESDTGINLTPAAGSTLVVTPVSGTTAPTVTTTTATIAPTTVGGGQCVNFDGDGDGVADASDNCPLIANAGQQNADGDAFGDVCDPCPNDAANDADVDGRCADVDNCPATKNPAQADADGDGRGNLCDLCPTDPDPAQTDSDGDGRGDACDCRPQDPTDLRPASPSSLSVSKEAGGAAAIAWSASVGADTYSVTRGLLADLRGGAYGDCLVQDVTSTAFSDSTATGAGQAYFYLVQAQSFDCGISDLGLRSNETLRTNPDPQSCQGVTVTDVHASGQTTVFGTVTGTIGATFSSDDTAESIQEVLSTGGNPGSRFSRLEQRWTFTVPAGSRAELHMEGWRTASSDGDDFAFEWSTDGTTFHPIALSLPLADPDAYQTAALPALPAGTLTLRVVDTNRTAGAQALDTVSIDEAFVRVIP
jgi:thrombospondin type 3 repeat protein